MTRSGEINIALCKIHLWIYEIKLKESFLVFHNIQLRKQRVLVSLASKIIIIHFLFRIHETLLVFNRLFMIRTLSVLSCLIWFIISRALCTSTPTTSDPFLSPEGIARIDLSAFLNLNCKDRQFFASTSNSFFKCRLYSSSSVSSLKVSLTSSTSCFKFWTLLVSWSFSFSNFKVFSSCCNVFLQNSLTWRLKRSFSIFNLHMTSSFSFICSLACQSSNAASDAPMLPVVSPNEDKSGSFPRGNPKNKEMISQCHLIQSSDFFYWG